MVPAYFLSHESRTDGAQIAKRIFGLPVQHNLEERSVPECIDRRVPHMEAGSDRVQAEAD
jgi:hypothetical protein